MRAGSARKDSPDAMLFAINLQTAKALGLKIPQRVLLLRANEVIE